MPLAMLTTNRYIELDSGRENAADESSRPAKQDDESRLHG
jgi:hypothetical protein